jgi:hypothetical protein
MPQKGLCPPAQGCRFGLPWETQHKILPQRGCVILIKIAADRRNRVAVET